MLSGIIDFSLRNRWLVVFATVAAAVGGVFAMRSLDIDAFPDITPVQVQVNTTAPALGPAEVERQVTIPIEQALSGLPKVTQMRSISKLGLSQVVLIFEDGTDIYFARQVVTERLNTVQLPAVQDRPKLGPVSSGLGEIFHYVVSGKGDDETHLRTVHDWIVRPQMRRVPGVAEVNTWGGYEKQFQVRVDPARLAKFQITFEQVATALKENNQNVGGGIIDRGSDVLLVSGQGRVSNLDQLKAITVTAAGGVSVKVGDVAEVRVGHEVRRGAVTADGKGEALLGLGFLTTGENSHEVTWELKHQLDSIKAVVPPGVKVEPVYDRTELVDFVIETVKTNLFEGGLFVVAVLFLFLGNLRAAAIVALAIPLSMLFAFSGMWKFGIAASLLSLGAIDFGMVVDSSVVMIENCVRRLAHNPEGKSRREVIREAAMEVRGPTLFGELIILIVYLPILTLEGTEGKMFRPMALTVIFALAGSMLLSMTLMPALASLLLPRKVKETEPLLFRAIKWVYVPVLRLTMRFKVAVLLFAGLVLFVAFAMMLPNLGAEFKPKLSEGAIALNIVRLPGTSLEESMARNTALEKAILVAFPDEVTHVWSRIGSADVATDPMGIELTDMFVTLKPRTKWKKAKTQDELTELVEKEIRGIPGQKIAFEQPIEMRISEMETGIRADLGVIVYGDDLDALKKIGADVERVMARIDGVSDLNVEQIDGQPLLQVRVKQDQIARYGIPARAVLDLIESIGAKPVGDVVDGQYRFPLAIRLADSARRSPEAVKAVEVLTPAGERIPLARLADVETVEGPSTITREYGQRRLVVTCNIRNRDLGSSVEEIQRKVKADVTLPPGRYHLAFGGEYDKLIRAERRLILVGGVALVLILLLLYATYGTVVDSLRVLSGIPFAWVGGIFALWLRDMPLSIPAAIGFIALSGVAVLDDMILVSYVRQLQKKGRTLEEAVAEAAVVRLRPVLMTTLVACLGFVPMAFSTGMGAEVQRPLATVVIGGVLSAMVMSLLVLRVLFVVFRLPSRESVRGVWRAVTFWRA